jgi:hypothetical protein
MLTRSIGISFLALSLCGCLVTGKTGDFVTIKPSAAQIDSAAKRIVCDSFKPIYFSKKGDSPDTIKQIRENNAAWQSFGCKP